MGAGMFLGMLSGAGKGLADSAAAAQKVDDERSLMQERAALEEQKSLRVDEAKRGRDRDDANRMRTEQTGRIETAANGLLSSKYRGSDDAVAEANAGNTDAPLTPAQQDAINQSKEMDRNDPRLRTKAAIQTGDISAEKAATLGQDDMRRENQSAISTMKTENLFAMKEMQIKAMHDKSMEDRQTKLLIAAMRGGNGSDDAKGMKLEAARAIQKDIAEVNAEMKSIQSQKAKNNLFGDELTEANAALKSLGTKREKIRNARTKFIQQSGINIPDYDDDPVSVKSAPAAGTRPPLSSFSK